jgi:hypothetical protein
MKIKIEIDGKTLYVKKPGYKELTDAKMYSAKIFNQARLQGAMLKSQLFDYMREQKLWDDNKQKQLDEAIYTIAINTKELAAGKNGKFKKLSDARKAAIDVKIARITHRQLLQEYTSLEGMTIDGIADQAHFDHLVFSCVYNEEGNRVFATLDDYFAEAGEPWARKCAQEISYFLYPDLDRDWEKKLPENQFLEKYGFVNADGDLVNKDGQLVDLDNKPIVIEKEPEFADFDNDM